MCAFARENAAREIIVGTETGIQHRHRKEHPGKAIDPLSEQMASPNMKTKTLDNLAECLREMKTVVTVPEPIAMLARRTVEAMLAM